MTDDLLALQHRVATLECQHRQMRVLVMLALLFALLAKVVAIWSLTRPKPPVVEQAPERIAIRGGAVSNGSFPLVLHSLS